MAVAIDRTPEGGSDANTLYFDAGLRHQVGVRNFTSAEVSRLLQKFEQADQTFTRNLRTQLRGLNNTAIRDVDEKLAFVLAAISESRDELMRGFRTEFRKSLTNLAQVEIDFEERLINSALPFTPQLNQVAPALLTAVIRETPFSSGTDTTRLLDQWLVGLSRTDKRQLREAIQLGLLQGDGINTIVARVAGTSSAAFGDGILSITRRNAEVLVRTAINHVSNSARNLFWNANANIIRILRWTATLDGRTTPICQSRDGRFTATDGNTLPPGVPKLEPPGARPPAHPLCRSVMMGAFDQNGIVDVMGNRPFVRDMRTGRKRQLDFRSETRAKFSTDEWSSFTAQERNARIRTTKELWAKENIGTIPTTITYDQWLRRQPSEFQDDVLGKAKGAKFRAGASVDRFVDRQGNTLTIKQLSAKGI
jgi:hypothetical protein